MNWLIILFIFILGLIWGSFFNCLIWRLKAKESILARHSLCPHCRHNLGFKDLFPVLSFLRQRGKCRYCAKKISWQYPAVELVTGGLFVISYLALGLTWSMLVNLIFVGWLIVILIYDLKYYLILDVVTVPAIIVALVANLLLGFNFWSLILAAIIGGGFFALQFIVSRGRWIGGGDIRLGLLMGLMLGYPSILVALVLAYFSGALVGLVLILRHKKKWNSAIPFGVFLSLATVVTLWWGPQIIEWYWRLLSP